MMNIEAAKAVADAIRTSLGPRGADKMVRKGVRRWWDVGGERGGFRGSAEVLGDRLRSPDL